MSVVVNTIVSGGGSGGGGGGSTTYAGLTDAATVNLPTVNTPLATALALKADAIVIPSVALAAGSVNITHALHLGNHVCTVAGTTTGVFAATGTSGAVFPDVFEAGVGSAGSFTASGAITAPTGYKLTAGPGETFTARYDVAADAFYSTTPSASAAVTPDFSGGDSFYWTTNGGGNSGFTSLGSGGSPYVVGTNNARTGLFGSRIWPIRAGIDAASASKARATWGDAQPGSGPHNTFVPTTNALDKTIYGRGGMGVSDTAGLGCVNTIGWLSSVNFNTDGSAQRNCFCLSNDAADANYSIITANGSASTKIALGSAFPVNTTSADAYEVYLSLTGGSSPVASYYVINRMTGVVARGTTQATLPVPGTAFAWNNQRISPTTAAAVSIDVISFTGGGFAQLGNT